MKALTLTQPWATLVAIGAKTIETRSWATGYRGPLAIHAAKGLAKGGMRELEQLCDIEPFREVLLGQWWWPRYIAGDRKDPTPLARALPRGAVVAITTVVDCVPTRQDWQPDPNQPWFTADRDGQVWQVPPLSRNERAFGDYSPSRYAWLLANVRALSEPIPAKGQLGLWEWTPPEGFEV